MRSCACWKRSRSDWYLVFSTS